MPLIFLTLLAIIILYFLFALLPTKICAICAAVSLTWISLLAAYFLGWHNDLLITGILMGGSIVGIMYKAEGYFKNKNLNNFWLVRILIIIFGFGSVYFLLSEEWNKLIFILILAILAGFFNLFFIKEKKENSQQSGLNKKLKERLEHCCD